MKHSKWFRIVSLMLLATVFVCVCAVPVAAALREGSRGSEVRTVQQKLKNWGYYSGEVDGIFGPLTTAAVKSFQRKNGLAVDGVVGRETFAALGMTVPTSSGTSSYQNDINMLARMIAAEGRGEPYLGQVAIGAVVMNRVEHASFPNTIAGVLFQSGAFSALDDGQYAADALRSRRITAMIRRMAVSTTITLPKQPINLCDHARL